MKGCCSSVLFCSETVADHHVPVSDREPRDELFQHLFSGLCATQPNVPACCAIARRHLMHVRVVHGLGSILSSAFTHSDIPLDIFRLCCASIGLDTSDYGHQLVSKLNMKLKAREPLNRIETLGCRSLAELASLHGLHLHSNSDQNATRDVIANHFLSGECIKTNSAFCDSVSSVPATCSPEHISPADLSVLILDGVLKTVTNKPMLRVLRLTGISHSPTDLISVHRKLLRKHVAECVCDTANNIASPDRNEETRTRLTLLVANVPHAQSRALPLAGPTPYYLIK